MNDIDDNEAFIILLNRKVPLKHLNLMYTLDNKLNELVSTKYTDISNIVQMTHDVKYDSTMIQTILNLMKSNHVCSNLFSLEDVNDIIRNYSLNHHFLTLATPHSIEPFTLFCFECQKPLKLHVKEKVNVFLVDRVDNGVTYFSRCCQTEYHVNSYIKGSKRIVVPESVYNQKYITFGGKCVIGMDLLLRYASDLLHMVSKKCFNSNYCQSMYFRFTLPKISHLINIIFFITFACSTRALRIFVMLIMTPSQHCYRKN